MAKFHILICLVLVAVSLALYLPTLDYSYALDDRDNITENEHIQITALTPGQLHSAATESLADRRPVANVTFALNYLIGGLDVRGFRLVNIAIHSATGILVYILAFLTFQTVCRNRKDDTEAVLQSGVKASLIGAAAAALIWTAHPLQTQSVIYIVQRMTSLATLFYLSALCLYIAGRSRTLPRLPCYVAAAASWILALGSKEIAVMLPITIVLYEWFFYRDLKSGWFAKSLKFWVPALIATAVIYWIWMPSITLDYLLKPGRRDFSMIERQFIEFRVVVFYITLILLPLPSRMNLDHHFTVSTALWSPPSTLICFLSLAAVVMLAIVGARRHRLLSFCGIWFLLHLALESSIINLELAFEHRLYLPSVGFVIGAVWLTQQYVRIPQAAKVALYSLVFCAAATGTFLRSPTWRDPLTLWADCVAKAPDKARPNNVYASYLMEAKKFDEAEPYLLQAIKVKPDYAYAHNGLGNLYRERDRSDLALVHYREAIIHKPGLAEAHFNIGNTLQGLERWEEAVAAYQQTIAVDPTYNLAQFHLGKTLLDSGDAAAAVTAFEALLRRTPDHVDGNLELADALEQTGRLDDAIVYFERAVELAPRSARAFNNYGIALAKHGRADAIDKLKQALVIYPSYTKAHNNMRIAFIKSGDIEQANAYYATILGADTGNVARHYDYAFVLDMMGADRNAEIQLRATLDIDPLHADAMTALGTLLIRTKRAPEGERMLQAAAKLGTGGATALMTLGVSLIKQGLIEEAIDKFKAAIAAEPQSVRAHLNLANAYRDIGNNRRALATYEHVIDLDPEQWKAHQQIAILLLRQGKVDAAIKHRDILQSMRSHDTTVNAELSRELARELARSGKYDEAFEQWYRLIEHHGESADILSDMGTARYQQKNYEQAESLMRRALEFDSDAVQTRLNLASTLAYRKRIKDAIDQCDRVLELAPDDIKVISACLRIVQDQANKLLGEGKAAAAEPYYRRAANLAPDNAELLNNFGAALGQQGKLHAAIEQFERALQLKPDYVDAKRNRDGCLQLIEQQKLDE
jgi:tetratricopeptide (TPR) repeat protein